MKTITQHILASILITVLVVLGGWGYLELRHTLRSEQERVLAKQRSDAEQLAVGLVYPLWNLNQAEVQKSILIVAADKSIQALLVHDEEGVLYSGVIREDAGSETPTIFDPGNPLHQQLIARSPRRTMRDILKGGAFIGRVSVYEDDGPLRLLLRQEKMDLALKLVLLILALAFTQFLVLRSFVIQPLTLLKAWVASIRPGQVPAPPEASRCEEIRVLTASFAGMAEELSESLRTQERGHHLLRSMMDNTFQLQGLLSVDGRVLDVNETALRMVGASRDSVLGRFFWETPWWSHDPTLAEQIHQTTMKAASGQLVRFETTIIDGSGELHFVEFSLKPVLDENGDILYVIPEGHDVTERKQAEEKHQVLETQLRQTQKLEAIGQLAGGVAHDINNMISAMLGHLELVRDALPGDHPAHRNLQTMEKAAYRSRDIMRQLLAFSRKQAIEPEVLNLNTLIPDIQKGLLPLVGEDIRIQFRPASGLWPIRMDPTQIEQIVLNLVVNARDAMPRGGQVILETANATLDAAFCEVHLTAVPGPYVLIAVTDTGTGMDEGTLSRIFEPFFTTKAEGKGTGLGLSTVFGIVQQNQGFIDVQSLLGQGTAFKVYLPAHLGVGEKPREEVCAPVMMGAGTILVVEDDESLRNVLVRIITKMGYQVLMADSPNHALALAAEPGNRINLLLTDVVMPEMSGSELRDRIEPLQPSMKTLFMSGYTLDQINLKGVSETSCHLITKPFSVLQLSKQLSALLSDALPGTP